MIGSITDVGRIFLLGLGETFDIVDARFEKDLFHILLITVALLILLPSICSFLSRCDLFFGGFKNVMFGAVGNRDLLSKIFVRLHVSLHCSDLLLDDVEVSLCLLLDRFHLANVGLCLEFPDAKVGTF